VLALERYPWTHASVHGNIGVTGPAQRELHEKSDMRGRNGVEQMRVLKITETGIIAQERSSTAASEKRLSEPGTGILVRHTRLDIGKEVVFMIAHEKDIMRVVLL
jgi:hypothetical protein